MSDLQSGIQSLVAEKFNAFDMELPAWEKPPSRFEFVKVTQEFRARVSASDQHEDTVEVIVTNLEELLALWSDSLRSYPIKPCEEEPPPDESPPPPPSKPMSWIDHKQLDYSAPGGARKLAELMLKAYDDANILKDLASSAGVNTKLVEFTGKFALLPKKLLTQAANDGKLVAFLAELVNNPVSSASIHDDIWVLLDDDAFRRVHARAAEVYPSFSGRSLLPPGVEFSIADDVVPFQKVLEVSLGFQDSALMRHALAQREARIARIDVKDKGTGTGWLVAPDLLITAWHVVSSAQANWDQVEARFDHKVIPHDQGLLTLDGWTTQLAESPLLVGSNPAANGVELCEDGPEPGKDGALDFALLRLAEPIGSKGLGVNGGGSEERGWFQLPDHAPKFDPEAQLVILGHPQPAPEEPAGPLKYTLSAPSGAQLTKHEIRVRYRVNTRVGNSGSPVMDESLNPVALHHCGTAKQPSWDSKNNQWLKGFNQGIPINQIVDRIKSELGSANPTVVSDLGLTTKTENA